MSDCLFCEIIEKKISAHVIAETENCIAFLDLFPVHLGHTLIVPKQHIPSFLEAPKTLFTEWLSLAQQVAQRLVEELKAPGINLIQNNGPVAGQAIGHLHLHVIPRVEGDGLKHWAGQEVTEEDLKMIAKRLRIEKGA